jgi:hypothetical protein
MSMINLIPEMTMRLQSPQTHFRVVNKGFYTSLQQAVTMCLSLLSVANSKILEIG